jgi:tetratricopeptide (TPR) repeat protein
MVRLEGLGERRIQVTGLLVSLTLWTAVALASPAHLERALELYQRTDYDAALQILLPVPDKDAPSLQLIGQCYYMQGNPKKASEFFEKAVAADPGSSNYRLWLGRAYGRRAETSSFVTAPSFATKARQNFEKAVELDPRNLEAASDLFEYYLDAPGFLGGGLERAAALAQRIGELDPAEYHYAQARLAEKRKEFQTAENQLRRATELAPRQVGRLIDLAKFLAKQGRYQESDAAFHEAHEIAPDAPRILFEQASVYIRSRRNMELAKELLKRYLDSPLTPDDPPRSKAEALLRQSSSI